MTDMTNDTEPAPAPTLTYRSSPAMGQLFAALAAAQGSIQNADKSRENPHFKSRYATLADCRDACSGPLSAAGLAVLQPVSITDDGVLVTTLLGHSSGEWMAFDVLLPMRQNDAQSVGSAITYGRRYGLCAAVGVAPDDDDDGNAASAAAPTDRRSPRASQQQQPKGNGPATKPLTDEDKDKVDQALRGVHAARKHAGADALTTSQLVVALMGDGFRLNTHQAAVDFCTAAQFEIERIAAAKGGDQ
jgi:hypothetical protein